MSEEIRLTQAQARELAEEIVGPVRCKEISGRCFITCRSNDNLVGEGVDWWGAVFELNRLVGLRRRLEQSALSQEGLLGRLKSVVSSTVGTFIAELMGQKKAPPRMPNTIVLDLKGLSGPEWLCERCAELFDAKDARCPKCGEMATHRNRRQWEADPAIVRAKERVAEGAQ